MLLKHERAILEDIVRRCKPELEAELMVEHGEYLLVCRRGNQVMIEVRHRFLATIRRRFQEAHATLLQAGLIGAKPRVSDRRAHETDWKKRRREYLEDTERFDLLSQENL